VDRVARDDQLAVKETVASLIARSFDGCEPIAQRSAGFDHDAPLPGPPVTVTRNRRIARRFAPELGRVTIASGRSAMRGR
jgi:hypothetical protein